MDVVVREIPLFVPRPLDPVCRVWFVFTIYIYIIIRPIRRKAGRPCVTLGQTTPCRRSRACWMFLSTRGAGLFKITLAQGKNRFLTLIPRAHTSDGSSVSSIPTSWSRSFRADWPVWSVCSIWSVRSVWSVWSIAHVAGREPYNLHDLAYVSRVGPVLYRPCAAFHNGRFGSRWSTAVDRDLSDLSDVCSS